MDLNEKIEIIPRVGYLYLKRLKKMGIETVADLIYHIPSRYIDYSLTTTIASLQEGEVVTLKGEIRQIENNYVRRNLTIQKAWLEDKTGKIRITWFNQPYLVKLLKGKMVAVSGKVVKFGRSLTLEAPEYEIAEKRQLIHTGRLVPVYPETKGVSSKWLRSKINYILERVEVDDPLPQFIKSENRLLNLKTALLFIHQPKNLEQVRLGRRRLSFDELFYLRLVSLLRRREWETTQVSQKMEIKRNLLKIDGFIRKLPFSLTEAQKAAVDDILADLEKEKPMNRLLQGDVGSGKTVVAAIAVYACYLNGYNSLLMAPTEILAVQHYQTLNRLLSAVGVKVALKTSSYSEIDKASNLIIGTHALLHHKKLFRKIALVVIDEQHRFGVEQRAMLRQQIKPPHFLTMTATPIPRTIALTLYGELDLSIIDQLPEGRKIVKTFVVPKFKHEAAYRWLGSKIKKAKAEGKTEQAYIIYPLIEESEILTEVKAAKKEYERLKKDVFPDLCLGLVHGKLAAYKKNEIIDQFRKGEIDILVATSVVEVGMDIPNATIILIEGADRFGLAQLHQLRGRVGRSDKESYCLLLAEKTTTRLKAMEKYYQGLKLAEIDLKLRGAGEIYGVKQHGSLDLKFADLTDMVLIEEAQKAAQKILEIDYQLTNYRSLQEKIKPFLTKRVQPD